MALTTGAHVLHLDDGELRYSVAGAGPVLIFQAPGWGIGAGMYEATLKGLESRFTVVHYDPQGSGKSSTPAELEKLNVGAGIDDLDALRRHLEIDSFTLAGHSHGGFIALNYALKYPRHVSQLILVDAQVGVDEPRDDVMRNLPLLAANPKLADAVQAFGSPWVLETDQHMSAFLEQVLPLYFYDPTGAAAIGAQDYVRNNRIGIDAMKATSATNGQFLVREKLDQIRVPTLVIVGRHDFICSTMQADILHHGIKDSRLAVFEHSGHFPWIEEAELFFSTVIGFAGGAA